MLVILAASPIFSSLFAALLLGESTQARTLVTGLVAIGAIIFICVERLVGDSASNGDDDDESSSSVLGILAGIVLVVSIVLIVPIITTDRGLSTSDPRHSRTDPLPARLLSRTPALVASIAFGVYIVMLRFLALKKMTKAAARGGATATPLGKGEGEGDGEDTCFSGMISLPCLPDSENDHDDQGQG